MKNFLKSFLGMTIGVLLLATVFGAVVQRNNSKLELSQKSMLFTDTGTPTGNKVAWLNSGGNNIFYGPVVGSGMSAFITGSLAWTISGTLISANLPTDFRLQAGQLSNAIGLNAVAFGKAIASGVYSVAMGFETEAWGSSAIALGYDSDAKANYSIALGYQTQTNGIASIAAGVGNSAVGTASAAFGESTASYGVNSFSMGKGTYAARDSSLAIGMYNIGFTTSLFEIGMGTGTLNKMNAFRVTETGAIFMPQLPSYAMLATNASGMIYDGSGSFVPWNSIDTGFNNTGSDTIVPSEKAIRDLIGALSIVVKTNEATSCVLTGEILFSGGNFVGCDGTNRLQLN